MKNWLGIVVVSTCMSGCLMTREDLRETESKKANQEQVTTMQKAAADQNTKVGELEGTLRDLNGRIEILENKVNNQDPSASKHEKAQDEILVDQQKRIIALQEEIQKLHEQHNALVEQITVISSQQVKVDDSRETDKKGNFEKAEELFDKKEWSRAALQYQKYRESTPKGKKVAEATYKMGVCFQELGKAEEARDFFNEILAKYPNTPEARRAKIRLKKLK